LKLKLLLFVVVLLMLTKLKYETILCGNHLNKRLITAPDISISFVFSEQSVSNAGDVNGDGYDDLIIGVPGASLCYVLIGTSGGWVNMTQGFTVFGGGGGNAGWSVSGAGESFILTHFGAFYYL
jgi:hypothetical protein